MAPEAGRSAELGLGAVGAQDRVGPVRDEALADERGVAIVANKAIVMPASLLEAHEARSAEARDGLRAGKAALGEQFAIAINAVGIVRLFGFVCVLDGFVCHVARSETLAGQRLVAIATAETITMPGLVAERDAARDDDLLALGASRCVFVLVALDAYQIRSFVRSFVENLIVGQDETRRGETRRDATRRKRKVRVGSFW